MAERSIVTCLVSADEPITQPPPPDPELIFPWSCDFGPDLDNVDYCQTSQDRNDPLHWTPNVGLTPTEGTGPTDNNHGETKPLLYYCTTNQFG